MKTRLLAAVLALAGLLAAVAATLPAARAEGDGAKTLLYGRGADSANLDPHDIDDGESVKVCNQIYEGLVTYAEDGPAIVPCLATAWKVDAQGTRWEFSLRPGVRFHDGTPCDAAAVAFNFARILDEKHPHRYDAKFPYGSMYTGIAECVAADAATVVFQLKTPSAVFLANLAMFSAYIVSPTALASAGEDFPFHPVGTGPFKFERWDRDEKIVLAANADWWGGKPKLDRVVFRKIAENSVRFQLLRDGQLHIMDGINLADLETLASDPKLSLLSVPGMNFAYLAMNTTREPFNDPLVRKAVAHAVDRDKIRKLALRGVGTFGPNPLPPTVWGYAKEVADYEYNPSMARDYLKQAGKESGLKLKLWAMPNPRPYMPEPKKVAQILQADLKEVGIEVTIHSPEWQAYLDALRHGEHELAIMGWITDNGDPDNFLYPLLDPDNAVLGSALNISFYNNPEVHKLILQAQGQLDAEKRLALYQRAQQILREDTPILPLAYLPEFAATAKSVKGYKPHPIGLVRLAGVTLE
ncbi:MAG: ABC transporter substrate-binding protein [Planctomycetes bacterium]|nr:ABC transporter substrate-binding protein [Planctomycetota bacterium]